jgi:glyoxylase-like metal-dependent hydrolase (beta-lactamase superfamily II)
MDFQMKTRVLKRREPIEPKSWAWVVDVREHDKTKRTYEINPFIEVYRFHKNIYSLYVESVDGMGDVWLHLIVGPEKAMLIDTGFGVGDLKGLVDRLTGGKTLLVANTHPHPDHSWGNCQFECVYCHEYAVPYLEKLKTPFLWDHLFDENGRGIWYDFAPGDLIPYQDYQIMGCPNHALFDLGGGHEVELIFMPGHSAGGCCFLDKGDRVLFAGDTILTMRVGMGHPGKDDPYSEYCTVRVFRDELKKLAGRLDEFDSVFPGHFNLGLPAESVTDMLEACEAVVAEPERFDSVTKTPFGGEVRQKNVKNLGTLAYTVTSVG